jgi:hypothetical protein
MHPQPCVQNEKARKQVTTVTPKRPAFPARLVLTVSFVLSPVIGRFCHRRLADVSAKLDISVEMSGPHDFTVHSCAVRQRRQSVHRTLRLTFVTIAKRPSYRTQDNAKCAGDLGGMTTPTRRDTLARRANQSAPASSAVN